MAPARKRPMLFTCKFCEKQFLKLHFGEHEPQFCSLSCRNWGRPTKVKRDRHGYVYTYLPGGTKTVRTQIQEHRLVMQKILGRPLTKHETVHHKNGVRDDNRPENLELWTSRHCKGQRVSDLPPISAGIYAEGAMSLGA